MPWIRHTLPVPLYTLDYAINTVVELYILRMNTREVQSAENVEAALNPKLSWLLNFKVRGWVCRGRKQTTCPTIPSCAANTARTFDSSLKPGRGACITKVLLPRWTGAIINRTQCCISYHPHPEQELSVFALYQVYYSTDTRTQLCELFYRPFLLDWFAYTVPALSHKNKKPICLLRPCFLFKKVVRFHTSFSIPYKTQANTPRPLAPKLSFLDNAESVEGKKNAEGRVLVWKTSRRHPSKDNFFFVCAMLWRKPARKFVPVEWGVLTLHEIR